jgi:hypothetical protein
MSIEQSFHVINKQRTCAFKRYFKANMNKFSFNMVQISNLHMNLLTINSMRLGGLFVYPNSSRDLNMCF